MRVRTVFTSCADGDLSVLDHGAALDERRRRICAAPWSWLRQVHGARVVQVDHPGQWAGEEADAAVTTRAGAVLAVHTADCAPLVLVGEGVIGVAHVGWRGLVAGVIEETVAAMRVLGGDVALRSELGPCIRARCYAFGAADLDTVAARYGSAVRGLTADGSPALDVPASIGVALDRLGVGPPADSGVCTACSPSHWSFRAARDTSRQAVVAWFEP